MADTDGFSARPCVPVAEPGGDITWRLDFLNSGNRPLSRILGLDRLPQPGDQTASAPLDRGSQWRPLLSGTRPTTTTASGSFRVFYTTATSGWCDDPQASNGALLCPALGWVEWAVGQTLPVAPETVTGLQFEMISTTALAPAAALDVDVPMLAPAYSPTDSPNTVAPSESPTMAFNTVVTAARWMTDTTSGYTLTTEPPRVGVALAHRTVRLVKTVGGEAADQYAPSSFVVTLACTSVGDDVPLGDAANRTVSADDPVTVYDLPVYAECTLTEGDNGQTSGTSTTATVQSEGVDIQTATLTNVYEYASLMLTKQVDSDAVDQDGNPVGYGPFVVGVTCTFLGEPVYAQGYGPLRPVTVELRDDDVVTFEQLPATAECAIPETDDKGAVSTTIVTTVGDDDPVSTDGHEAPPIELAPDGDGTANTAEVTNTFDIDSLDLTKLVTGDVVDVYGAGPFVLDVSCVLDDETGRRPVWADTVTLGGDQPLERTIDDLATGAVCTVTEP